MIYFPLVLKNEDQCRYHILPLVVIYQLGKHHSLQMTTLEYYFSDGRHKKFCVYTIDEMSVITNVKRNKEVTKHNHCGYNVSNIVDNKKTYQLRIARAIASTFLGEPPTKHHTADHIDKDERNDVLSNIRWLCKSGQNTNQTKAPFHKSALIIVKDGIEKTATEWEDELKGERNHLNRKFTKGAIRQYAKNQRHGFCYKIFEDLPGEEWEVIQGSQTNQGTWYVSTEGRMKYKSQNAENVLYPDFLHISNGYPTIFFANKQHYCHIVSFKTFFPEEYSNKKDDEFVLHRYDNKLDFRPSMLYLGNRSQNTIDAYNNGVYDTGKRAQIPVTSFVNGVFEKTHKSLRSAIKYLKIIGITTAGGHCIKKGMGTGKILYDRTWEFVNST
ncbi:hypothetical protein ATCVOR07043_950R [Acanthocystis turfacea Chlorella virus OR0704.3]|nr:hypothetical protein ATCVOR07043_950R [Acanthocystis turfacea Chlorella virus OR0704.3]